jgi:hypothetical protein
MQRLLDAKTIRIATWGPQSKRREYLEITGKED